MGQACLQARRGEIAVATARDSECGAHAVLWVGFDPQQARFSCLNTRGRGWGHRGLGRCTPAVARELVDADGLWSVEPSAPTVAELTAARAQSRPAASRAAQPAGLRA
jgi:hypothetical protein